ncbi:hypothetical protein V5E97_11430 [Singulisphaera sp. Ch08]|uniref:Uncharacterized protein n=1 Tax=Singulisphaera sp. Ch08 TaxID=3120278 RepID=A0AAU7CMG0_9BACT
MPRALADVAQEYVAGVGGLFRPAADRVERAARALVAGPELQSRASGLLVGSEEFNAAGAAEVNVRGGMTLRRRYQATTAATSLRLL